MYRKQRHPIGAWTIGNSTPNISVTRFGNVDTFQGFYQIRMASEDVAKTTFVTREGVYCFKVMPFGLRNAGATYQRLVNRIF